MDGFALSPEPADQKPGGLTETPWGWTHGSDKAGLEKQIGGHEERPTDRAASLGCFLTSLVSFRTTTLVPMVSISMCSWLPHALLSRSSSCLFQILQVSIGGLQKV